MKIVITGGGGFLGTRLSNELLIISRASNSSFSLVLFDQYFPSPQDDPLIEFVEGSINDVSCVQKLIDSDVQCIYHLAAVLSGGAENDYDAGMKVNIDGTRTLLDACRTAGHCPRLIFASSVAVFGIQSASGLPNAKLTESSLPTPLSSYGTQKAICELLIADASRRGFVDGVSLRLPTIAIRPGSPNSAASSFVSSIIREPLKGVPATCPVGPNQSLWIQSPRMAVLNLLHARTVDFTDLPRVITLPGLTTTPREMVDALVTAGGDESWVTWREDERVAAIVSSWPGSIEVPTAISLGFQADTSISEIIHAHIEDTV